MSEAWGSLLRTDFLPHGHCYQWQPAVLWLNVGSDALIAGAYFSIPFALFHFVRHRRDLDFDHLFYMFAAFIVLCGITHAVGVYTVWEGAYGSHGLVKAATAGVSLATAVALWRLMPRALAIPSLSQLRRTNHELAREVARRVEAERELRELNVSLEERVRARTHELERSNRDLADFAHVAAHDLRAPLRGINTLCIWLETDKADCLDAEAGEHVAEIRNRVARLSELVEGVLAYSRAGVEAAGPQTIDLQTLLADVIRSVPVPASVRVKAPRTLPQVVCDPIMLRQVLQNLVVNALQHMGEQPAGTIQIAVRAESAGTRIAISDDGLGARAGLKETLFRPFQGVIGAGTGVELAIVRRLVERMGGVIEVRSEPGKGSTFAFTIPAN